MLVLIEMNNYLRSLIFKKLDTKIFFIVTSSKLHTSILHTVSYDIPLSQVACSPF